MSPLPDGLYDLLITAAVERELAGLSGDRRKDEQPLDATEADVLLARHVARAVIDEGARIERSPFEAAVGQIFIGTASWIESMQALIDCRPRNTEHPSAQRFVGRPSVDKIIEVVAGVFVDNPRAIRQRHGGPERRLVCWLGCYEGMSRLGGIADALRLRSTSSVSKMIAECDRELTANATLRVTVDRCTDLLRRGLTPVGTLHRQSYPSIAFGH